jgi:uncharacterized protein YecT (DUF1311 family)
LAAGAALAADPQANCTAPKTTYDINICSALNADNGELELQHYLEASRSRIQRDPESLAALNEAQIAWEKFRASHCAAVYSHWRDGTIRGPQSITCRLEITRARTHQLWKEYLTYVDRTPPLLPEPEIAAPPN